jgi:hypothetical protein
MAIEKPSFRQIASRFSVPLSSCHRWFQKLPAVDLSDEEMVARVILARCGGRNKTARAVCQKILGMTPLPTFTKR